MNQPQALTITGTGLLRVLSSPISVCTPIIDKVKGPDKITGEVKAIWDTGASGSVITQSVVDTLQIQPISMVRVNTASGQEMSPVYLVDFILPMGVIIQGLRVTRGKIANADVLIGMDVITIGDFTVTNKGNVTKMTFRVPSQASVDYVEELQTQTSAVTDSAGNPLSRQQRRQMEREQFKKWKEENKEK